MMKLSLSRIRCASVAAAAMLAASGAAQGALAEVITFDDLGLSTTTTVGTTPFNVGFGYTLQRDTTASGSAGVIIYAEPGGVNSFNSGGNTGYRYLTAHNAGQVLNHTLTRSDGGLFDLTSVDYQGWNNNFADELIIDGYLDGGGIVTESFTITNFNGDPFHTAILSSAFTGLTSVVFRTPTAEVGVAQIDNIEVSLSDSPEAPAPEPSTLLVVGAGLLGLRFIRRRRG